MWIRVTKTVCGMGFPSHRKLALKNKNTMFKKLEDFLMEHCYY